MAPARPERAARKGMDCHGAARLAMTQWWMPLAMTARVATTQQGRALQCPTGDGLRTSPASLHPSPVIARNEAIQRPWCTIGHRAKAWIAAALRASQ